MTAEEQATQVNLQTIVDTSKVGILVISQEGETYFCNPAAHQMLGNALNKQPLLNLENSQEEIAIRSLNGQPGIAKLNKNMIDWDGKPVILLTLTDITESRQSLSKKELFLKELHHRIKNNLQILSSILNMEMRQPHHPKTLDILKECQNRIHSMALIHEQLSRIEDVGQIDLNTYIYDLVALLKQSLNKQHISLKAKLPEMRISLPMAMAIACGLLLNELVSNAYKHAFPSQQKGWIKIELKKQENHIILDVKDNGIGLSQNIPSPTNDTLGINLIHLLSEQLDGQMSIQTTQQGSHFQVTFPV